MSTPSSPHHRILAALHDQSARLAELIDTATRHQRDTRSRPLPSWYREFQERAFLREALEQVACAGGVPRVWIEHVHHRGSIGAPWRAELPSRPADAVDWDQVLAPLCADVARLVEWSALDVARRAGGPERGFGAAEFDHNLAVLRARTTGIANTLALDADLGELLWGTVEDWAETGAAVIAALPAETILDRWNTLACTDTHSYALQASALHAAGIAVDTSPALPAHTDLVAAMNHTLPSPRTREHTATIGRSIESSLTAATGEQTPVVTAPFSHAHELGTWECEIAPDRDIPLPLFVAPAEELGP